MSNQFKDVDFKIPKVKVNKIKVIGVGGGGGNAVNHMYGEDLKGVDFVICNTDAQALVNSPIPNKIQIGENLTDGEGAGANPQVGAKAAKESLKQIQELLSNQTKMVFITAGMGGGTGTGAAPIIAKVSKDMGILTVGIVTMPFLFEGKTRIKQAQDGISQLRENVDSLIVINNNKLREVYGNLGFKAGFSKADEVLSTAAKGIAEVITSHYKQNIDLRDAKTVLENSGTAIMGSSKEIGENRAINSIKNALDSPLLNDNKITGAKNVLLLIVSGNEEVTIDEIGDINDHIQKEAGYETNIIMGVGEDESLGEAISITIVATGFAQDQQNTITNTEVRKTIHVLGDEQTATVTLEDRRFVGKSAAGPLDITPTSGFAQKQPEKRVVHNLEDQKDQEYINSIEVESEVVSYTNVSEEEFTITHTTETTETEETTFAEETPIEINLFNSANNDDVYTPEDINSIEVNDAVEITLVKRHLSNDFDCEPTIGKSSNIDKNSVNTPQIDEFEPTLKIPNPVNNTVKSDENEITSPLNATIDQLRQRRNDRVKTMRKHNHTFTDQTSKNIDELERVPAYKRNGIDLDDVNSEISKSKTSLNTDNEDIKLNNENSFLHDNVD